MEETRPLAVSVTAKILLERIDSLASTMLAARPGSQADTKRDFPHLDAWTKAWKPNEADQENHLFHMWQQLSAESIKTPEQFAARKRDLLAQLKRCAERITEYNNRGKTFVDFRRTNFHDWFVTGEAFGSAPSKGGELLLNADGAVPVKQVAYAGQAHSGLVSNRLQVPSAPKRLQLRRSISIITQRDAAFDST